MKWKNIWYCVLLINSIVGLKPLLYLLGLIYKTSNNVEENVSNNFDKNTLYISSHAETGLNVWKLDDLMAGVEFLISNVLNFVFLI